LIVTALLIAFPKFKLLLMYFAAGASLPSRLDRRPSMMASCPNSRAGDNFGNWILNFALLPLCNPSWITGRNLV
jgi:hypothetical protein